MLDVFVLRCLALTQEHWASFKSAFEPTITTSSRSHSRARSLSQFSIPSLAVALVHVLAFFPNRKCSMLPAFSCCSDATLPPTQSTNSGGESRNTAGLPNFFAEAIVSTGNPIVRQRHAMQWHDRGSWIACSAFPHWLGKPSGWRRLHDLAGS
jgi:hypothetical protein